MPSCGNAVITTDIVGSVRAAGCSKLIQAKRASFPVHYFSASKIKWLLDHVPGARAAEAGKLAFGTVDARGSFGGSRVGQCMRLA